MQLLSAPCKKIETAEPAEIPSLFKEVLMRLWMIWEMSSHFNSIDRMKSLLTKISNQIIQWCRYKIKKEDMLEGDVEKCMRDLDESIQCC